MRRNEGLMLGWFFVQEGGRGRMIEESVLAAFSSTLFIVIKPLKLVAL